jgi:hypothetical protein
MEAGPSRRPGRQGFQPLEILSPTYRLEQGERRDSKEQINVIREQEGSIVIRKPGDYDDKDFLIFMTVFITMSAIVMGLFSVFFLVRNKTVQDSKDIIPSIPYLISIGVESFVIAVAGIAVWWSLGYLRIRPGWTMILTTLLLIVWTGVVIAALVVDTLRTWTTIFPATYDPKSPYRLPRGSLISFWVITILVYLTVIVLAARILLFKRRSLLSTPAARRDV